jgi:hypothetical protein
MMEQTVPEVGRIPPRDILTASVDLEPGALSVLNQLRWLRDANAPSQMAVNEACTLLIRHALTKSVANEDRAVSSDKAMRKA